MWEDAYCAACAEVGAAVRDDLRSGGTAGALTIPGNAAANFKNRLTDTDVAAVVAALRSCPGMSELCFPYNCIGEEGGVLLGEALGQHADALITLDLRHNHLGAAAAEAIANGVAANDSLCTLLLAGNPLGNACGPAFGAALRRTATLTHLDLANTEMGVAALVPLCRALEANRSLAALHLGRPLLRGPDDVASVIDHLAAALRTNTTLEELDLRHFGLTDGNLQALVVALCGSAVTSLGVRANKLSEDAGQLLGRLLQRRHDFRHLDISCNRLRDKGASDLAAGLAQHPQLTSLAVESCTMGEAGLVSLIAGLRSCAALRALTLWGNEITPGVAQALSRAFGDLRKMETVDFGIEQREGEWVAYRV